MIHVCANKNSPPFKKIPQFSIISEDFRKLKTVKDKLDYNVHEDLTICGQDPIMVNNIKQFIYNFEIYRDFTIIMIDSN